jgi:hypothetical protein
MNHICPNFRPLVNGLILGQRPNFRALIKSKRRPGLPLNLFAPSPGDARRAVARGLELEVCSGPVAPGPKPGGVAPSPARPPHSTVAIGGQLPQGLTHWPITSGIAEATATMRVNTASMPAALAAKSDEQDRRIAALEAAASGQRRAASPRTVIRGRPPPPIGAKACSRLPGSLARLGGADGRPFGPGRKNTLTFIKYGSISCGSSGEKACR